MSFIKSFSILAADKAHFPFTISAIKYAQDIKLNKGVTILVGDNGTGKSTVLESLAMNLQIPLIGGFIETNNKSGFEAAKDIRPFLSIDWWLETNKGFFFRAEDFNENNSL